MSPKRKEKTKTPKRKGRIFPCIPLPQKKDRLHQKTKSPDLNSIRKFSFGSFLLRGLLQILHSFHPSIFLSFVFPSFLLSFLPSFLSFFLPVFLSFFLFFLSFFSIRSSELSWAVEYGWSAFSASSFGYGQTRNGRKNILLPLRISVCGWRMLI